MSKSKTGQETNKKDAQLDNVAKMTQEDFASMSDRMTKLGYELTYDRRGNLTGFWYPLGCLLDFPEGKVSEWDKDSPQDVPVSRLYFRAARGSDGMPPSEENKSEDEYLRIAMLYIAKLLAGAEFEDEKFKRSTVPEKGVKYKKDHILDLTFPDCQGIHQGVMMFTIASSAFRLVRLNEQGNPRTT